jgi:hypothetical protein
VTFGNTYLDRSVHELSDGKIAVQGRVVGIDDQNIDGRGVTSGELPCDDITGVLHPLRLFVSSAVPSVDSADVLTSKIGG